jgi:hypothetical protein
VITDEIPSPLVLYVCAAMRHALEEWRRNDGCRPAHNMDRPRHLRLGEYFFSAANDGRRSRLRLPLQALANVLFRGLLAAVRDMEQPPGCISEADHAFCAGGAGGIASG